MPAGWAADRAGLAFYQFQHEAIRLPGFFQAVDGGNIRMIERSQRAGLAAETRQTLGVPRELSGQGLDGDVAAELASRERDIPRPCRRRLVETRSDTVRIAGPEGPVAVT